MLSIHPIHRRVTWSTKWVRWWSQRSTKIITLPLGNLCKMLRWDARFDSVLHLYCILFISFSSGGSYKMSSKNLNHLWNIYCFTSWYIWSFISLYYTFLFCFNCNHCGSFLATNKTCLKMTVLLSYIKMLPIHDLCRNCDYFNSLLALSL